MLRLIYASLIFLFSSQVMALEITDHNKMMDHGGGHLMDMGGGMVMGQNTDRIPDGCDGIAATKEITVHGGHKYAEKFPGRMFAFDVQEYQFEPCTKLTVNFINEDKIRHQWMMHGLPKYLYPKGMFHLEVTGPGKISGTLILPPGDKTYLVHCDLAQHMEKGMKGQLKTGNGTGDLPSIPGVTEFVIQDDYANLSPVIRNISATPVQTTIVQGDDSIISGVMVIGLAIGLLLTPYLTRQCKGKSSQEIIAMAIDGIKKTIGCVIRYIAKLSGWIANLKGKTA